MLEEIAKYINSSPNMIQIAKDGQWEKVWQFSPHQIPSPDEISSYLSNKTYQDFAVELVFETQNNSAYIFGMEFSPNLITSTPHKFLSSFLEEAKLYKDFTSFIKNIESKIIGKYLFISDPDVIRIGIVNHWFSIGPCLIWQKGWPKKITESDLEERLKSKPEVVETNLNYQGLSFVFNLDRDINYPCHWMKSPCSEKNNGIWKINVQMTLKDLHDWMKLE